MTANGLVRAALAAFISVGVSACSQTLAERATSAPSAGPDWQRLATRGDRARLAQWRTAFVEGLRQARAGGHAEAVAREGRLLDPDAGAAGRPGPGDWRCRVIKLGAQGPGGLPYVAYPNFACRIAEDGAWASFRKLSGSQRPTGLVFPGGPRDRPVFLGTMVLGDETRAIDYGQDPDRDMAGLFEEVEPNRWRLLLPRPRYESVIDVIEVTPAS